MGDVCAGCGCPKNQHTSGGWTITCEGCDIPHGIVIAFESEEQHARRALAATEKKEGDRT